MVSGYTLKLKPYCISQNFHHLRVYPAAIKVFVKLEKGLDVVEEHADRNKEASSTGFCTGWCQE